ncbi:MAG: YkgJ family cysteine cluster protein, partial [archaeon]|nr:YkgJ family cysteine cluster protein [archaeon]
MKIDCIGLGCDECCKRYWITLLPEDANKIAKELKVSLKDFLEKECFLIAHIYPKNSKSDGLTINSKFLPSKLAEFVGKEMQPVPSHFLVLPAVTLKRDSKGECVFLSKGKCKIYPSAPPICKLFPVVALSRRSLKDIYPFCKAMLGSDAGDKTGELDREQRELVSKYFESIKEQGFSNIWKHLPLKAVVLIEGKKELFISKEEFLQL